MAEKESAVIVWDYRKQRYQECQGGSPVGRASSGILSLEVWQERDKVATERGVGSQVSPDKRAWSLLLKSLGRCSVEEQQGEFKRHERSSLRRTEVGLYLYLLVC